MSTTVNSGLNLPEQDDFYDVDIFNENSAIIDEELKRIDDGLDGLAAVAVSGSFNSLTYKPFIVCANMTDLNNALSALDDSGGVIYLLGGSFAPSGDLSIVHNNITLIGSGKGTVIGLAENKKIHILGNNVVLKNLAISRATDSTGRVILLDSDGESGHNSKGFTAENVDIAANGIAATDGIVSAVANITHTRLLNCSISSNAAKLIAVESGSLRGIVSGCIASSAVTVPDTMTTGCNINISLTSE